MRAAFTARSAGAERGAEGRAASLFTRPLTRRSALRIGGLWALACAGLSLSGCVDQHPERSTAGAEGAAPSLVATSPAAVDICDRLELDLVGVPSTQRELPARYQGLPTVGGAMSPDLEIIKSLRPDYVIAPNSLQSDLQPQFTGAGLACIFLDLKSVPGMYDSVAYLGAKFDRQAQSDALVADYEAFMADYAARVEGEEPPTVLILMGVPGSYVVATENSYVGSLVKLAGGINVYAGEEQDFINVNTEDMLARDPDIILRTAHALPDQVMAMFAEEFAQNDIWKHFRAVEEGCVFDLSADRFGMSAGFSYPEALDELAPLLYGDGAAEEGESAGGAQGDGDASGGGTQGEDASAHEGDGANASAGSAPSTEEDAALDEADATSGSAAGSADTGSADAGNVNREGGE